MTVIMSVFGAFVFIFSLFTVGYQVGVRRLWVFALTGFSIDLLIVALGASVMYVN